MRPLRLLAGHRSHPDRRTRAGTSFEVVESKLHPPWVRPGIVARTALVERLLATPATPVICVVGPAGYGKTTLLAQWAQRSGRRVAWVSVDRHDNDPAVLLSYLTVALDHIAPVDPGIFQTLASPGAHLTATVVPRLAGAISRMAEPVALVLDHVELLHDRACLDLVAELAVQLPSGSQLALASRTRPRLPLALLRTQGRVVELGASDLAMDQFEARALLEGAQVRLADNLIAELHRRTEGWPVGLYLAALALQAGAGSGTEADAGGHVRRGRPAGRRLPVVRAAVAASRPAGVVPDADGRAGPHVRAAVRRGPWRQRVGQAPCVAGRVEPAAGPAGPSAGLVPLPPPVPRPAARRAPAA